MLMQCGGSSDEELQANRRILNDNSILARGTEVRRAKRFPSPHIVQIMGGINFSPWWRPRDAYREGRPLTATMPVYLNAIVRRCIVITNEYQSVMQLKWWVFCVGLVCSYQPLQPKSPAENVKLITVISLTNQLRGISPLSRDNMLFVRKTWYNVHWTMPWSMRLTRFIDEVPRVQSLTGQVPWFRN